MNHVFIGDPTPARRMRRRVSWASLVGAAEKLRGERWEKWAERHGDWGRDAVMYVAVRYGGLRLAEVVREVRNEVSGGGAGGEAVWASAGR